LKLRGIGKATALIFAVFNMWPLFVWLNSKPGVVIWTMNEVLAGD
jgi:hypothetical protein